MLAGPVCCRNRRQVSPLCVLHLSVLWKRSKSWPLVRSAGPVCCRDSQQANPFACWTCPLSKTGDELAELLSEYYSCHKLTIQYVLNMNVFARSIKKNVKTVSRHSVLSSHDIANRCAAAIIMRPFISLMVLITGCAAVIGPLLSHDVVVKFVLTERVDEADGMIDKMGHSHSRYRLVRQQQLLWNFVIFCSNLPNRF